MTSQWIPPDITQICAEQTAPLTQCSQTGFLYLTLLAQLFGRSIDDKNHLSYSSSSIGSFESLGPIETPLGPTPLRLPPEIGSQTPLGPVLQDAINQYKSTSSANSFVPRTFYLGPEKPEFKFDYRKFENPYSKFEKPAFDFQFNEEGYYDPDTADSKKEEVKVKKEKVKSRKKRQGPEEFDFIIVGAGSAGCVLANRLSEVKKWKEGDTVSKQGGNDTRIVLAESRATSNASNILKSHSSSHCESDQGQLKKISPLSKTSDNTYVPTNKDAESLSVTSSLMPENNRQNDDFEINSSITASHNNSEAQPDSQYNLNSPVAENLDILSIATADINIESPNSSFTIPSVSSVIQSDASSCGSPLSSRNNNTRQKKTTKIRTRNVAEWKDLKRKALKNSGQKYISRKGSEIPERILRSACKCPKKCVDKVCQEERETIFKRFWEIADHERQWEFISKCIKETKPQKIKAAGPNKSRNIIYTLLTSTGPVIVCKIMFLNTLSISDKMVRTVLKKQSSAGLTEGPETHNPFKMTDLRGRHGNRPHKLPDTVTDSVKDHVESLVPIESHYCRKNSSRKYLDGHLSYKRLHQEYLNWFDAEKYGRKKATMRQYSDIVNSNFNIAFHSPKKDQCDKCHMYSHLQSPTEEQKEEHEIHIALKNLARSLKDEDKTAAQNDRTITTACFDMQKVLNCPHGQVSIFFYKRRLNLYDFTVFDLANKLGFCYMWDEATGKKGANEIGSGLLLFVKTMIAQGAKHFRFWSDNCSGQNRNRIVFALYQHIVKYYDVESITHRFLEVGHTQNEGDSVHSVIERASNNGRVIYTPEQWFNIIRWAKTTDDAYRVKEMTQDDILDLRSLLDGRNWVKNDNGDKVMWNKVKEVFVEKNTCDVLQYKYDLGPDQEYKAITTQKKTRSKKIVIGSDIKKAYTSPLNINFDKYRDLMIMCDAKIIPEEFESYFRNLPHHDRPGINNEESDSE